MSVKELAKGTVYTQALETGWKPPAHIRALTEDECEEVRAVLVRLLAFAPSTSAVENPRAAAALKRLRLRLLAAARRFGTSGTSLWRETTCRRPFATSAT